MLCPSPMINGNLELLAAKLRASLTATSAHTGSGGSNNPFSGLLPPGPVNIFPSTSSGNGNGNNNNYSINQIPEQVHLQLGFLMDDVLSVLELDTYYQALDSTLLYVADPLVYSLSNGHGQTVPASAGALGTSGLEETVLTVKTGDVLVVEGEGLASLPLAEGELNITVGTGRCPVASLSMRQIICNPPSVPPPPTDETGRRNVQLELPAVILRIGSTFRRHLGYLHYGDFYASYSSSSSNGNGLSGTGNGFSQRSEDGGSSLDSSTTVDTRFYHQNAFNSRFDPSSLGPGSPSSGGGGGLTSFFFSTSSSSSSSGTSGAGPSTTTTTTVLNLEVLIGVLAFTGVVLAILSVLGLAAYRHKTTEAEREYRRIQLQMDTLESSVRSECKQAFAELQTDILQASGLLSLEELHQRMTCLPTHDERTFLLRMMTMTMGTSMSSNQTGSDLFWKGKEGQKYNDQLYSCSLESAYFTYGEVRRKAYGSLRESKGSIFWQQSAYFNPQIEPKNCPLPGTYSAQGHGLSLSHPAHTRALSPPPPTGENFYTLNSTSGAVGGRTLSSRVTTLTRHLNGQSVLLQTTSQTGVNPAVAAAAPPASNHSSSSNHTSLPETFLETLLLNRNFILVLVEVLESQATFTSADRLHFASLLTLSLLDRMEYTFDVMRHLLARQIDTLMGAKGGGARSFLATGRGGPGASSTSGEATSVAEKMLADWLSVCLFKYVREVASGPLFLLHSAVKHQVEKGPVDALTGMSR